MGLHRDEQGVWHEVIDMGLHDDEINAERDEELARLSAENERLRAALKRIADDDYTREDERLTSNTPTMIWQAVARQALGIQ